MSKQKSPKFLRCPLLTEEDDASVDILEIHYYVSIIAKPQRRHVPVTEILRTSTLILRTTIRTLVP